MRAPVFRLDKFFRDESVNDHVSWSEQDPLGALVQGMAQLQSAMSESLTSRSKEPEVVKPGLAELPRLPEMGQNSAIDIGDWLHGLQNHMGDLSNNSGVWWAEVMACLSRYYEAYLAASHVGKLAMNAEDYESDFLKDGKWSRVDKRASSMILACVSDSVKSELLSTRLVGTLAMLSRIVVLYRPGSIAERQQVLRALENPHQAANAADAVVELRKWARWMARATDIGIQCPDASVLVRGLDSIVRKVLADHADIAFRISMLRYTLEVDTRPTIKGARDLQQALMSELEQVAFRSRATAAPAPSVKAASVATPTTGAPRSEQAHGQEANSPTAQAKTKAKTPCRFFLTDKGCSKGSSCTYSYAFTRKEKQGRCWACGSTQHHQPECPTKNGGGSPSARVGAAPKHAPIVKAITETPATTSSAASVAPTTTTSQPEAAPPTTVPESELKSLLQEASAMLKEIRQLKTLSLTTTQVQNQAVGVGCDPATGRTGLLDSGASHPFREASQEELLDADHVRVQLAGGREVVLSQGRHGSLLAEKTGAASSAPIVPLGALVQELGCQVSWSRRGGLVIRHPQHGAIRPEIVGRCPVVAEAQALDLIKEIESQKLQSLENATGATARALWLWDSTRPWAQHLSDFVKIGGRAAQLAAMTAPGSPFSAWSEMERALIAENIELSDRAGWSYLRALPGSRQRRKRMMALPWVVHLYSGPGRSVEPVFRELDDGRVLVQIDINRSKAEDMNVVAGAYRALLWAAATGRIDGIIGSPPNRPELVQRMMWLTVVAKAARAVHGGHPVFALIEGCRVLGLARRGEVERWSSVSATWGDFLEATCLEEFGDNLATNLRLKDPIPESVGANSVWTFDFKEAVVEAIKQWGREPEALQVMKWIKKLDAADGSFLGGFTDKELEMWRTHVRNNHVPFNRRCGTCVRSTATGRSHRRVKHPSAYCLSLDIAGPFRNKAADPNHRDYRYLLVGAYVFPKDNEPDPHAPPAESEESRLDPHAPPAESEESRLDPHAPPAESEESRLDPHAPPAESEESRLDPHAPLAESGESRLDPHALPAESEESRLEPHAPPAESKAIFAAHGDDGGGVGAVAFDDEGETGDGDFDPMEEMPERRGRHVPLDDDYRARGLSQEEFTRIYNEVGVELSYDTIYLVRPLRTRTAVEVTAAVQELALKLKAEGLHISRVHADRARELRVEPLRRWLLEKGILVTYTEGQAPQANGRAEAAVKWTKAAVKRLLMASGLGKENWAVAANYAVHDRLERTLRRSSSMLPFGTKVHVRSKVYGTGGRYDLNSRWQAGSYVGPSLDVRGGHVIRLENGAYMTSTHLRPHLVEPDKIVELDEYEVLLPMPTRRLRTKAGARVLDPAGVADEPCLKYDPGHPAEQYAMRLLDEDILTPDQCEILALMLPSTAATPKRFGPQGGSQKVWSAGAFVHGGVVGVKTATVAFPASTRVFVKYAKQLQPDHKFNAVAITVDIGAQQHVDAHNVGLNLVAGLSFFKGGGLEIEESEGKKLLPLDGDHTHQLFDPHVKHSTRPWYSGSRVVLVAYSVRDSGKLSNDKVDYLKSFGFEWIPHTSRTPPEEESLALRPISVSLLDAAEVCDVPEQHRDSPEQEGVGEVVVGCDVPEQPRDSPEQEGVGEGQQLSHPCYDSLCYLTEDVELAIGDLEDRAARLRDLLEEEEIMCEEYRRMGQVARDTLGDARAQVCEFLEGVHEELIGLERQRATACLKAARATVTTTSSDQIDYEEMLSNMEGDLKIVHTVPIEQVKRNLSRWVEAIRKKVTALLDSGTLRRISLAEARQLEKDSRVMFAPAKCVFTLKPPQEAGKRARRKCRVVICGNYIRDNLEFGDLYASGTSTDALRLSLVIAALRCWLGAVSDITGAFLLASWPPDLPKYGIYPPRVVKDSGVTEAEAWIVERPLYGLRESPRIWSLFRNERLRRARIKVGEMTLVLRPTVAEPELWMILCEVTGSMHGLIVLYVDDIAYFSTEEIIKAIHEFIVQEWPASPLEWISADAPVRYLGVEIWREPRTSEGGEASWVYTIGQSAYVKDLLREHNMSEVHPTDLPAPREWIEEAESSEEVEGDYDESTLKLAQRHVGECLWLATKTRPDIMFVTTHAASLVSKRPSYVIRLSKRVLAYLAGSADLRMTMGSIDEDQKNNLELIAFTDASYAPYGKRSFGAAVITLAGSPVAWKSGRQSFITLSVMEAELYAATQGCTLLNSVEALAAELLPTGLVRVLVVDNTSAAAMLAGGPGSQRTRHLKIRANYVREAVEQGRLVVRHMPGSRQLADLSTKMQTKVRLQQLLGLWGFVGFSVNLLETVKLKLLAVLMIIAQCICPARGEEVVAKDPLPSTTWDEVAIMMVGVAIVAVCGWECLRCCYRRVLRWQKRWRRAKKLEKVSQFASTTARKEIAATQAGECARSSTLKRRAPTTQQTPPRTPSPQRPMSMPTTPQVPTASASASTMRSATPPTGRRASTPPTMRGEFEERARIAKDTLMLMRVEELKSALRLEGMLVSGLKNDLAERLLPRLVGTDVTNKQLKYVLFLWRAKALEYKCILRWEDINNKYRVSAWISRWKDT